VWLPLPHLLMLPFLLSNWLWQTGIGGSIPSMAAYVLGSMGMFRLIRVALSWNTRPDRAATLTAFAGAAIFAANPNLIYLQTTAMTEAVYLALFIWSVVFFLEFARALSAVNNDDRSASSSLTKCGLCLAAACLTRYDGWFLAALIFVGALVITPRQRKGGLAAKPSIRKFALLIAAAPLLWLAYNAVVYRNPLEFANGPYSAKAIEQKSITDGVARHPGSGNLRMAANYFLKAARLNMAESRWQGVWLALLVAGIVLSVTTDHRLWLLLLLCAPIPFYMLSVAYSGVPIYVPMWWPHSIYNARYGIELLPAFAAFTAIAGYYFASFARNLIGQTVVAMALLIFVAGSYASIWRAQPICLREAWTNSRSRIALESELANYLGKLPVSARFLMYLGDHVGAWQKAGIPLRTVINEGNHRPWKRPADPDGLWERALAEPDRYVDFVIAVDGDAVAHSVGGSHLIEVAKIHSAGQPMVTVYRTLRSNQPR
jgi:hypothetical protein